MPNREAFRQIQELLGLEPAPEGEGGSVYKIEVQAIADRVGVPYVERVKTWRAIIRALGVQPKPVHVSTEGTITDEGFKVVLRRLKEIEDAQGQLPDPIVDCEDRPIHLLLRWNPEINPDTVEEHRAVAATHGAVWWGKIGNPARRAIAADKLAQIASQLAEGQSTWVYLHRQGELWRTRLEAIATAEDDVEPELVPSHYDSAAIDHHLWLKLSDFQSLAPGWAQERLVYASDGQPVGFKGMTSLFLVREADAAAEFPERYFIFNIGAGEHQEAYGDEFGLRLGFDSNVTGRVPLLEAQQGRFVYYRTSKGNAEHKSSFIGQGRIESVEATMEPAEGKQRWVAHLTDYEPFENPVPRTVYEPPGWNIQHGITEISADAFEQIVQHGTDIETEANFDASSLRQAALDRNLRLDDSVYEALAAAILSGKHVMLTGPPGTAKTTLAQIAAKLGVQANLAGGFTTTTATADWTTYETIGGLRPAADGHGLEFRAGHLLEAAAAGRWLVIDELNRSNFDRAFGQLFTVLSGQSVILPYENPQSGKPIALVLGDQLDEGYTEADHHLVRIPASWRIIATMNVLDKSLLFEMSFALMRRFAFVEVPAPQPEDYEALWIEKLEGLTDADYDKAHEVLLGLLELRSIKEVGPAVFLDMARFAAQLLDTSEVTQQQLAYQLFYSYLLPQFEGVDRQDGERLYKKMSSLVGSVRRKRLRQTLNNVLGLYLPTPSQSLDEDEGLGLPEEDQVVVGSDSQGE